MNIPSYEDRQDPLWDLQALFQGKSMEEQEKLLWELLKQQEGKIFYTAKGLEFTYKIRGGEMFVSRKEKSITQASVFVAFRKVLEFGEEFPVFVPGPKKLGIFGASYLYPVFWGLGMICGKPENSV